MADRRRPSDPVRPSAPKAAKPRRRPVAEPVQPLKQTVLPAAWAAWDGLRTAGHPLTRDTLGASLRAADHRVGNDRLTPLLADLRDT